MRPQWVWPTVGDVEFIDVTQDEAGLRAWYVTYSAGGRHGKPHPMVWAFAEILAATAIDWPRRKLHHISAVVDGRVVAAGSISFPQLDHLVHAAVEVFVAPADRGRGYGSALLAHLEGMARAAGRHIIAAEVLHALDDPADAAGVPDAEFARRHGYKFGLGDVMRRLALPVSPDFLTDLADSIAPAHAGYVITSHYGSGPADIAYKVSVLDASLTTEAPMGEMSYEAEAVDVESNRIGEQLLAAQRRSRIRTVAMWGQEVVGYCDTVRAEYDGNRVWQWGTQVHRDHRGHRLGLALKIANMRALAQAYPEADEILTFNAEVNTHMIAVNDQLGYVPVARLAEFEKHLV